MEVKDNTWFSEIFGTTDSFGNANDLKKSGNKGVYFWGKNTFKKFDGNIEEKVKLLNSARQIARLITKKPVSVTYSKEGEDTSYTDGKSIVISSEIKDKYDVTIGLTLHESSHILLTDFKVIRNLLSKTPEKVFKVLPDVELHQYSETLKQMHNWVEDRRIDKHIYDDAVGFRVYYIEMYKRYFLSPLINEAIKNKTFFNLKTGVSKSLTDETFTNYIFYLVNFVNPNIKKNELKGLQELWDCLDLYNISRLKTTQETLDVAVELLKIILKHIPKEEQDKASNGNAESDEGDDSEEGEEFDGTLDELLDMMSKGKIGGKGGKKIKLSDKLLDELKKHLQKQKDFMEGKVEKGQISAKDAEKVNILSACETSIEHLKDGDSPYEVLTVNKVNKDLILSGIYGVFENQIRNEDIVKEGIEYGKMLGKKLKLRTEERSLVTNRLSSGKIDKRRLSDAGYGSSNLFYHLSKSEVNNANIHISLDLSGSMHGEKWKKTLKTVVAIAKACSMIQGMRCQISLRYEDLVNDKRMPIVINFYDSAYDNYNKLYYMVYIDPCGATPEGLCFEALMQKIMLPIMNKNTLFINFSDGMPGVHNIGQDMCIKVTKDSIRKMKDLGVKVLSYYIEDTDSYYGSGGSSEIVFKNMYGEKESSFIDTTELSSLAKTINNVLITLGSD